MDARAQVDLPGRFVPLVHFAFSMGAAQSTSWGAEGQPHSYNNQDVVAAMLLHHHRLALENSKDRGSATKAVCPIPHHGRRGAMAPSAELNPLNNMPELTQDRAPNQSMNLSRERVVSSIPRAPTSAAPGDSPYGAAQCPIPHESRTKLKSTSSCPVDHTNEHEESPGYWEYPSPQQFYNALVRKGWETPEESVDMMVLIHNFLNERAWQEIVEWEKMAGSDVSKLQLARFQGKPGTLTPKARMYGWLAWAMPDKFSSEPPFDRHDWIVRRGPSETHPNGEEVRYIIDYYSREDDSDENEASFNLDVRPAISNLDTARLRWKKLMQEYESGELFAPFREQPNAAAS